MSGVCDDSHAVTLSAYVFQRAHLARLPLTAQYRKTTRFFKTRISHLPISHHGFEAATMVAVHLEMEPFSGPIDLSKTALVIIDMQVRIWWSGIKVKGGTRSRSNENICEGSLWFVPDKRIHFTLSLCSAISWSREVSVRCLVMISQS
jgi:hypothetical protein